MITKFEATSPEILAEAEPQENILVLKYCPALTEQLSSFVGGKRRFEAILIDATEYGFLFSAENLIETAKLVKPLLLTHGTLAFLIFDRAVVFYKGSLMGNLSFLTFENYAELYDYSPALHKHVQQALGKPLDSNESIRAENTDLTRQVLMSTIPVFTEEGIKLKARVAASNNLNAVLAAMDNYTPLATLLHRFIEQNRMTEDDLIEQLKCLESGNAIYPIFPRIDFLANCFKNQIAFSIADYLLEAKLLSKDQLDALLLELNTPLNKDHLSLGPLALKNKYINARELEIILQDQAFYGKNTEKEKIKTMKSLNEESQIQSLVGRLGRTDPSNLLQNIAQNRESGVLAVEYKDLQFRALFDSGRVTHAKSGKVLGNAAIIEFVTLWGEGVFVFTQRTPPADLIAEACSVKKPLDKLLLDSALAKDNLDITLAKFPKGLDSIFEQKADEKNLLDDSGLKDLQDGLDLQAADIKVMKRLWQELNGLTTLRSAIRRLADITTIEGSKAAERLLGYELVTLPKEEISQLLDNFRKLSQAIRKKIGVERSLAYLRLSLKDTIGYSGRGRIFVLGSNGEVGIDMASAQSSGASLSVMIRDMEEWQVKYVQHASQEIDSEVLISLIREVHES
jgi:Domain of unknown function (DUF4388)